MKYRALSLAVCFALASGSLAQEPASAPAAENLIANPSFENKAGDRPADWHVRAAAPRYITDGVAGENTHSGSCAVMLSNPTDYHQRWAVDTPRMIAVDGGQTVIFSAWVKVSGLTDAQFVQLRVEQFGADGKILAHAMGVHGEAHRPEAGKWVRISDELKLSPDARSIRPLLVLASAKAESDATVIFDDVELVKKEFKKESR